MNEDGTCPTCGRVVEAPAPPRATARNIDVRRLAAGVEEGDDDPKAPWHFKLMMVLLALYLTWRIVYLFI